MKRLIFSVWNDLTEKHPSVPLNKLQAFHEYKDILIDRQKQYATLCGADYEIFSSDTGSYVDTQFFKIHQCEKMCEEYDQVVYFDLDIIPKTKENIFENFKFGAYFLPISPDRWLQKSIYLNQVHSMNRYAKLCCKKAMLLLDGIPGNDLVANTGVLVYNKNHELDFTSKLKDAREIFKEACEDNLYPEEISSSWEENNEVFFTYMIEKYQIKHDNIGIQWNFILDHKTKNYSPAAHLIHQVNKDFKVSLF
jgi:hypothetical protein